MEFHQIIRLIVFGYLSFLPNLLSYWVAVVLPEVIQNNLKITDKTEISKMAGYFYSSYFFGLVIGSLTWPYLIKIMSKKMALLCGLFFQGLFTFLTGVTINLQWFFMFRILTGFFNNINTVGKDFIFEFAKPKYRQYAFSIKSVFTMLGIWISPLMGYYLYNHYDKSLEKSMTFLAMLFMMACGLFIAFFYIDFMPVEIEEQVRISISIQEDLEDKTELHQKIHEESLRLLENEEKKRKKCSKGIIDVLKEIWRNKSIRNYTIIYFLTNGVGTTKNVLLVFYMETSWAEGGLEISPMALSLVNIGVFIACMVFLLISPIYVPSKIAYMTIIKQIVVLMILTMVLMPIIRDVLPNGEESKWIFAILFAYGMTSFFNPKLFSPFINYFLNDRIDKNSRTSMNSITFIGSCLTATLVMSIVSPFFSLSMHHKSFTDYAPYNKYVVFLLLDVLLVICLCFLKAEKVNEI